jgi:hypothetical protein
MDEQRSSLFETTFLFMPLPRNSMMSYGIV